MPRKDAARPGLAERDARRHDLVAEDIATLALRKVNRSFLEQRVAIRPGPESHTTYHHVSPLQEAKRRMLYPVGCAARRPNDGGVPPTLLGPRGNGGWSAYS